MIKTNAGHVMVETPSGMVPEYEYAVSEGYSGTEAQYVQDIAKMPVSIKEVGITVKVYEIEFNNISFTAGSLGTRGAQYTNTNVVPANEHIISILIDYISDSSSIIPIAFYSGVVNNHARIFLNLYRATDGAVSNNKVVVRVVTVNKVL